MAFAALAILGQRSAHSFPIGPNLKTKDKNPVLSAPGLTLADNDGGHDLLTEIGLTLLHGGHHHVTNASGRKPVEATLDPLHRNDVEVLRTGVVGAVHRRRHRQTQRHPELVPRGTSAS
ncbi:Initiation-specific alpha-1,6-mannosyltransferase [Striga asiatica]|uniref:Initiation-specific alpha-1,6-mannosyltransferase n=1 Tax=Striga asiatica TaxID=4170 RepID=A0A5A7NXH1_STRAF|nr:Initiation-specific alpha-1,6-mannosyltransferase [Striga asiatica]